MVWECPVFSPSAECLCHLCIIHGFCTSWWCFEAKGGILANSPFCKRHTDLYKYWSKWGRYFFLRYSKYSCQVYCIVLSGTAQKLQAHRCFWNDGAMPWRDPTLGAYAKWMEVHRENNAKKWSVASSILYCHSVSAEPGVGVCLDSRSHKNGGLCVCMGLFIHNWNTQPLFSRGAPYHSMVTRNL